MRYAPDLPQRVVGDSGRIRQVLLNLVGNALKFTERGSRAGRRPERVDEGGPLARSASPWRTPASASSPDKLDSVFEKFTQADGSITRRYGGTGLGLSISKQLVELMDGEIHVTSAAGSGSIFAFTLTLPLDADAPAASPPANLEDLRVLVVHRRDKVRSVLAEQIAAWRSDAHGVATAADAIGALRAAHGAGHPFHVAIISSDLTGSTPEELAAAIKNDPALQPTALVLLVTLRQRGEAEGLQAAGFDTCLTAPVRPWLLPNVLAAAWDIQKPAGRS